MIFLLKVLKICPCEEEKVAVKHSFLPDLTTRSRGSWSEMFRPLLNSLLDKKLLGPNRIKRTPTPQQISSEKAGVLRLIPSKTKATDGSFCCVRERQKDTPVDKPSLWLEWKNVKYFACNRTEKNISRWGRRVCEYTPKQLQPGVPPVIRLTAEGPRCFDPGPGPKIYGPNVAWACLTDRRYSTMWLLRSYKLISRRYFCSY